MDLGSGVDFKAEVEFVTSGVGSEVVNHLELTGGWDVFGLVVRVVPPLVANVGHII